MAGSRDHGCCAGQNLLEHGPLKSVLGKYFTFKPDVEPGESFLTIAWSFNRGDDLIPIVSVVNPHVENINDEYKGRMSLNKTNGILTLGPLMSADSGDYAVTMISLKGIQRSGETHLQVLGERTQRRRTQRVEQPRITLTPDMKVDFMMKNRSALIAGVTEVMGVLDDLLSAGVLGTEAYDEIKAEKTSQAKVRMLHDILKKKGKTVMSAFYDAVQKREKHLVEDLKEGGHH